jgi:muconate cycloisomerase
MVGVVHWLTGLVELQRGKTVRIDRVHVYKVILPFQGDFFSGRKKRVCAENIIVEVVADKEAIRGYGEGAPRWEDTEESQASAARKAIYLTRGTSFPWELSDISQIRDFVDGLPEEKCYSTAICALEMALLDALSKSQDRYITEYFPKGYYADAIHYGFTIPAAQNESIIEICKFISAMEIKHLRIKMGEDFERNKRAMETVRSVCGDDCELRIDPNGVWKQDVAFQHIPLIKEHKIKVVEEPMEKDDPGLGEFAEVIRSMGVLLMACQSAPTLEDIEKVIEKGYHQMINVKLSRSGGFQRTLRNIEYLRNRGISFQIGCNLGESGVLSAAGRGLCLLCKDAMYYDGSYDRFLLRENITADDVSFGIGGEARRLDGPGLGVQVNGEALEHLSDETEIMTVVRG